MLEELPHIIPHKYRVKLFRDEAVRDKNAVAPPGDIQPFFFVIKRQREDEGEMREEG